MRAELIRHKHNSTRLRLEVVLVLTAGLIHLLELQDDFFVLDLYTKDQEKWSGYNFMISRGQDELGVPRATDCPSLLYLAVTLTSKGALKFKVVAQKGEWAKIPKWSET